jgi:hypothetical protein
MKKTTLQFATVFAAVITTSQAAVYTAALSPGPGLALNLGATTYTRDHGIGLSGLNEPGQFTGVGTGNIFGAGITYNDVSNLLTFDFAYGSAFSFTDLAGNLTVMHIHAPGNVNFPAANTNGGVILDLASFHTASGTKSGRITGSTVLDSTNETRLLDNQLYVNIHSTAYAGGEIRGQIVLIPEPSTALLGLLGSVALVARRRRR